MLDDIRGPMFAALAGGEPVALATLFRIEGGGPRPVGTQMVFAQGQAFGFLSGGCIEADVALYASEVLATGEPRRLVYGPSGPWPDIRLLCGVEIEILVERILPDDPAVQTLMALRQSRQPAFWASNGITRQSRVTEGGRSGWQGEPFEISRIYWPQSRLIVVGLDPAALAMAQLGVQSGFETWLNRPKGPQSPPPIQGLSYSRADPWAALTDLGLDPWTYIAIASHDLEIDHSALIAALKSNAAYVGLLGARRRLDERITALQASGLSPGQIARLHAPIGLDLGGKAPWEVAISVLAQIIQIRQQAMA
jgi:xanthine dehydrogenase accessory factor